MVRFSTYGFTSGIPNHPRHQSSHVRFGLRSSPIGSNSLTSRWYSRFRGCRGAKAEEVSTKLSPCNFHVARYLIRNRANNFLDEMNEKLFKPNGLFCLVMAFKPESDSRVENVDISQTILKSITSPNSSGFRSSLKTFSGKTHGELRLPESAPLIFPALDTATPDEKQNALKKSTHFVADYYDRRGQALFVCILSYFVNVST